MLDMSQVRSLSLSSSAHVAVLLRLHQPFSHTHLQTRRRSCTPYSPALTPSPRSPHVISSIRLLQIYNTETSTSHQIRRGNQSIASLPQDWRKRAGISGSASEGCIRCSQIPPRRSRAQFEIYIEIIRAWWFTVVAVFSRSIALWTSRRLRGWI